MKTLLVDGDIIAYKAAFAAEQAIQWDDQDDASWTLTADLDAAKRHAAELIEELREIVKADEVIIALTHCENWRKAIYPAYKAPRKNVRKPVLLKPMRAFFEEAYKTFERPTLEADDVLGILATGKVVKGTKVIASIDKDLLQIPGQHLNIDSKVVSVVTEEHGDKRHFMQTLTGDVVDNYPGCPGIGPMRAYDILAPAFVGGLTHRFAWVYIVDAFKKKGLTEDDALTQARISRICRSCDYDFTARTVKLWNPPNA